MEMTKKFNKAKQLISHIEHADSRRKQLLSALKAPSTFCTINYGFGSDVYINDTELSNRILEEELIKVNKRLQELFDELENLK
jgi:hypothetical protein